MIAAKQGSSEIPQASVVVRPTFKWWVSGHKHGPDEIMHSPQPDDYLNAYEYIRWKYWVALANTGGTFATVTIATTQTVECDNVPSAAACTSVFTRNVEFGSSTFSQGENQAASIIGHELIHASGVFSECTAYQWEKDNDAATGIFPCDAVYLDLVRQNLFNLQCP